MNPTELYHDYKPALSRVCARLVHDARDQEEVVHDAFMKIFSKLDAFDRSKASLYTWMRKIVINTALDAVRGKHRPMVQLPEDMDQAFIVESHFRPDELLKGLPPAPCRVLKLNLIEGYSHREIGAMLGISEGTSRWHLSEGRKILRNKINQLQ